MYVCMYVCTYVCVCVRESVCIYKRLLLTPYKKQQVIPYIAKRKAKKTAHTSTNSDPFKELAAASYTYMHTPQPTLIQILLALP